MNLVKDGFIVVSAETTIDNTIFDQVSRSFRHLKGMRCHSLIGLVRYLEVFSPSTEKDLVIYIDVDSIPLISAQALMNDLSAIVKEKKRLTYHFAARDLTKLEAVGVPPPLMLALPIISETSPPN